MTTTHTGAARIYADGTADAECSCGFVHRHGSWQAAKTCAESHVEHVTGHYTPVRVLDGDKP